jgi:hypothetical protein
VRVAWRHNGCCDETVSSAKALAAQPARLTDSAKSPELGSPARGASDGIVPPPPQLGGAPSPRTLDLLQKFEPDLKKGRGGA